MLQSGFSDGFKAHWLGEEFHKVRPLCIPDFNQKTLTHAAQKSSDQSPTGQLQAQEKSNIPKQRIEFREVALLAEEMHLRACAAATESEKPMCKYGPMCHRFGNVEWAHHAHKYKHPGVALKVFVLGPPQCGKTQLCSLLEEKTQPNSSHPWLKSESWQLSKILLNFPHIVDIVNQVFDYAEASTPGGSSVSSSFFSDSGVAEDRMTDLTHCAITCLRSSEEKHCGWILENFPRSIVQLKIMAEEGVMPHCVVNIEGPSPEESSAQELLLHRERQAVLSELQRCGIKIITVSPPVLSRTKSDSSILGQSHDQSSLPLKRTASGSSLLSAGTARARPGVAHSLIEQACSGIASFLHSTAVSPYAVAFPLQVEKRCNF